LAPERHNLAGPDPAGPGPDVSFPRRRGSQSDGRPAPLLVIRDLVAGYGSPVVRGVSLNVGEGEVVALVGPNGCGKSTLLKAVVGLITTTSGTVTISGSDITNAETYRLAGERVGYVPQNREVFDSLTVTENLQVAGSRMEKRALREALNRTFANSPQLQALRDRRAGVLSGGERRILAIAMVQLLPRQLLILDEPTAALAPSLAIDFLESQIPAIASTGTSVLIVEQRVHAAFSVADWAYSMLVGKIHMSGPPEQLMQEDEFAQSLVG
jgi:ABC-type branched-subunit amino acid transport system ATPase component